ncbi:MAG: PilZ domain-containing protein [Candidatus Aureabacteria bacterium]|nr:PilZ domain-containing protein [Candidatus Auribacterota bacterium]
MNKHSGDFERRREPRIKKDFSLQVSGIDVAIEALDITPTGLNCLMDNKLPELSEMKMEVSLPKGNKKDSILCSGIVVRSVPDRRKVDKNSHKFAVALYFLNMGAGDRTKIKNFVR